jgi:hypothetical protein
MDSVENTMRISAQRMKVGVSQDAINSLSYTTAAAGSGAVAQLSFKQYLRFVDMGVGKGHPLGGMTSMKVTLLSQKKTGSVQLNKNGRKPKKVYSKPAYGKLNWLENQLLYGYSEEAKALLQAELTNP